MIAPTDDRLAGRDAPARLFTRARYLKLLGWAFALFSSVRVVSYLPALVAIWQQGDSSQHSLWTWATWLGANGTMALWLYEHNGQRMSGAAWVSAGNAVMCGLTTALIVWFRV